MIIRKIIIIILIILGGLALLAIGYFTGVGSVSEEPSGESQQVAKTTGISSKVIMTIIASGEVSSISDRIITITRDGESINVSVKEDTQISSTLIVSEKGKVSTSKQAKAEFSDIKVDSQVSAIIRILPDNKIEAVSVNILPVFNNPK